MRQPSERLQAHAEYGSRGFISGLGNSIMAGYGTPNSNREDNGLLSRRVLLAGIPATAFGNAVLGQASARDTEPKIVEVSVPPDSSDGPSWSSNQNVWSETFPIRDVNRIGIGYIVEPEPFHRSWSEADFVMHDHMYISPGVPDPRRANITYRFSKPAKIGEVLIVQHANGIGQIEGFIGNDERNMKSIGRASSTLGADLPAKDGTFTDGYRDLFKFERRGEGRLFRMVITRTPLPNGYAFFRAYPRNNDHKPYEVLRVADT
jgi:hypothetical protein